MRKPGFFYWDWMDWVVYGSLLIFVGSALAIIIAWRV